MEKWRGSELWRFFSKEKERTLRNENIKEIYERDFVNDAREYYFKSDYAEILVVSGLRGTGKTFGLLQAAEAFEDVLYITSSKSEDETGKDYIELLKKAEEKYIIIDEYSWIKEREELDSFLYTLTLQGKRVAVTGTDSIALDFLSKSTMIHRVMYINVNMFTYQEYCRIYQKEYGKKSSDEYLKYGGVFKSYVLEKFDDMVKYVEEAVINNLANCINIEREKAKALIYDIMYLAVCPSSEITVSYPNSRKNDARYQQMLRRIGIDPLVTFDAFDFERVSKILIDTGFVVKTEQLFQRSNDENTYEDSKGSYRLNLTNPSLTYQMVSAVFDDISAEKRLEMAFEASVVSYMSKNLLEQDKLYLVNMGVAKPELEIVVVNREKQQVYLMDAKEQDDCRLPDKKSLVSEDLENEFQGVTIEGRYVICNSDYEKASVNNGKKVIFTNIESKTLLHYDEFEKHYKSLSIKRKYRTPNKD